MKKYLISIAIVIGFYAFYSCNNKSKNTDGTVVTTDSLNQTTSPSESNSEFPFDKAKKAALKKIDGEVLGYYKETDNKIVMYILGSDGKRWMREFVLLSNDKKDAVWLMLTPPFGSTDTKFELLN